MNEFPVLIIYIYDCASKLAWSHPVQTKGFEDEHAVKKSVCEHWGLLATSELR